MPKPANHNTHLYARIYRLKLVIAGISAALTSLLISLLADHLEANTDVNHLVLAVLRSIADVLIVAGALGIMIDFFTGKDKKNTELAQTKEVLTELTPEITDAVLHGFAASPDSLQRVATTETLDQIATNALGLRLKDAEFASEIYADLVENAIRAPERWHDVDVRIRLSSIDERSTVGAPRFAVTVTWEYTVTPSTTIQRFACTSNRDEFHELVADVPSTSTWFMTPRPGFNAAERDAYELLQYTVDGVELPIRRAARKAGQQYTVELDDEIVREQRSVRVRHTYRTITAKHGHLLVLAIAQPTKGLTLTLDYTETDIASVRVSDLISSARRPRLTRLPEKTEAREITMDVSGWLLPQAEVTFVWTLNGEMQQATDVHAPRNRVGSNALRK